MQQKTHNKSSYWDIKVSIAKSIACEPKPSTKKLRHDILEEFGYPPEPELVHLFLQLSRKKTTKKSSEDDKRIFAESIAQGAAPSVLKFRNEFQKEYNVAPSNELTSYFLQKIQDHSKATPPRENEQGKFNFAKTKAQESNTILQFRTTYKDTFGEEPPSELVTFFLKSLSRNHHSRKIP